MTPTITERPACLIADRKTVVIVKAEIAGRGAVEVIVDGGRGLARRIAEARRFAPERLMAKLREQDEAKQPPVIELSDEDLAVLARMGFGPDEVDAARREITHLHEHAGSDEAFKRAALAGPCFCAGKFQCTKCGMKDAMS